MLYPGDNYEIGSAHDCSQALKRFDELPGWDRLPYDRIEIKSLDEIFDAYRGLAEQIHDQKWSRLFEQLSPIYKWVPGGLSEVQSCPRRRSALATDDRRGGQLGAHHGFHSMRPSGVLDNVFQVRLVRREVLEARMRPGAC